ncbi:hypothetical protein D3C79_1116730 [compost metagenome]
MGMNKLLMAAYRDIPVDSLTRDTYSDHMDGRMCRDETCYKLQHMLFIKNRQHVLFLQHNLILEVDYRGRD